MKVRAWVAFAAVGLFWGSSYLFIKIAVNAGVSPGFIAWVQVTLGGTVLVALALRLGLLDSVLERWRWLLVYGIVELAIPLQLIAWGEQRVSSSLAAIIVAAAPLFVALLALRFDQTERATGTRWLGLGIGLLGVVALVGLDVSASGYELIGAFLILAATVCYAIGSMVLKRHLVDLDPRVSMGAALVMAAVLLTPLTVVDPPSAIPSAKAIVALLVLGILCTSASYTFFAILVAEAGAGRALVVTYVIPVVAGALGVAALDERLGAGAIVGLPLILAGSWLATGGRVRKPDPVIVNPGAPPANEI